MPASFRADKGSAVVEFALVSIVLVVLLLAVLQVAIYVYVRNVVAASAAEGARYGADADVDSGVGGPRARDLVASSVGRRVAGQVPCAATEEPGAGGTTLVAVRCRGRLSVFFAPLGRSLPVDVTGRSLKEGR